jgi:hypothetical protein
MPSIMRNNIRYGSSIGGCNGDIVELTQEQYDALGDSVLTDNKTYYITDADDQYNASSVIFDNTDTNLNAVTVQDAIVEQNKNFEWKFFKELTQSNPTSTLPTNFNELLVEIVDGNYGWVFNINILKSQLSSGGLRDFHTGFYTGDVCACAVARVSLETISTNVVGNAAIGTSKIYYR